MVKYNLSMATNPTLTRAEAEAFLTKDDLEKLMQQISEARIQAVLADERSPVVVVRGKVIKFFDVLSILGKL